MIEENEHITGDEVLFVTLMQVRVELALSNQELARILNLKKRAFARIKSSEKIKPKSELGKRALFFIDLYIDIYSINDGDKEWMMSFFNSPNQDLDMATPRDEVKTIQGLYRV